MNNPNDLVILRCRIDPLTNEKIKSWSNDLGLSMGEMIVQIVDGYEHFCNAQDEWLKDSNVYEVLSKLIDKVEKIEQMLSA